MIAFLQVNPVRTKELTNVRAAGKDENVRLSPPRLVCRYLIIIFLHCLSFSHLIIAISMVVRIDIR